MIRAVVGILLSLVLQTSIVQISAVLCTGKEGLCVNDATSLLQVEHTVELGIQHYQTPSSQSAPQRKELVMEPQLLEVSEQFGCDPAMEDMLTKSLELPEIIENLDRGEFKVTEHLTKANKLKLLSLAAKAIPVVGTVLSAALRVLAGVVTETTEEKILVNDVKKIQRSFEGIAQNVKNNSYIINAALETEHRRAARSVYKRADSALGTLQFNVFRKGTSVDDSRDFQAWAENNVAMKLMWSFAQMRIAVLTIIAAMEDDGPMREGWLEKLQVISTRYLSWIKAAKRIWWKDTRMPSIGHSLSKTIFKGRYIYDYVPRHSEKPSKRFCKKDWQWEAKSESSKNRDRGYWFCYVDDGSEACDKYTMAVKKAFKKRWSRYLSILSLEAKKKKSHRRSFKAAVHAASLGTGTGDSKGSVDSNKITSSDGSKTAVAGGDLSQLKEPLKQSYGIVIPRD
jgi:hypothetical protein